MAAKDTLYFELRDSLVAGGCALCRQGRKASDSYLNSLIYEGVTDRGLRENLREAHGLCRRHAWRIARRRGSVLGIAIIYQDVINSVLSELDHSADPSPWWRAKSSDALVDRLQPSTGCPACRLEGDAEKRASKTLVKHLGEAEIAELYQTSGGLCLPHFRATLLGAGSRARSTLLCWQRQVMRGLHGELGELIRKHDYRFSGEPIGKEADSWERAVALVIGEGEPDPDAG
jgi:hypothetical protein